MTHKYISNKINESIQLLKKADVEHCQKYNRSSGLKQVDWDYINSILKRQAEEWYKQEKK